MKLKTFIKIVIIIFLLSLVIIIPIYNGKFINGLENILDWIDENILLGVLLYLVLQLVLSLLFLPTTPLAVGMSFIFTEIYKFSIGFLLSYILLTSAAIITSIICFYVGRYIFQNEIEYLIQKYPKLGYLNHMMEEDGIKITILLRISPLIPFSLLNYFLGSSNISFKDYIKGTFIGSFFWILLFCFLGSSVSSIKDALSTEFFNKNENLYILVVIVLVGIFSTLGTMFLIRKTNREINTIVERSQQDLQIVEINIENIEINIIQ